MPNIEWESVSITALFEGSTAFLTCLDSEDDCTLAQNREMAVPDYLFAEIEQYVLKELLTLGQIPPDAADDSQNVLR
jgi:hypothetical protein